MNRFWKHRYVEHHSNLGWIDDCQYSPYSYKFRENKQYAKWLPTTIVKETKASDSLFSKCIFTNKTSWEWTIYCFMTKFISWQLMLFLYENLHMYWDNFSIYLEKHLAIQQGWMLHWKLLLWSKDLCPWQETGTL